MAFMASVIECACLNYSKYWITAKFVVEDNDFLIYVFNVRTMWFFFELMVPSIKGILIAIKESNKTFLANMFAYTFVETFLSYFLIFKLNMGVIGVFCSIGISCAIAISIYAYLIYNIDWNQ